MTTTRRGSIFVRILGAFLAIVLLQIVVAAVVWHSEHELDIAAVAETAAAARTDSALRQLSDISKSLLITQTRLGAFLRSGTAAERKAVTEALATMEARVTSLTAAGLNGVKLSQAAAAIHAALDATIGAATEQRAALSSISDTVVQAQNGIIALALAASRADRPAMIESSGLIAALTASPLTAANRYAFTENPRDRAIARNAIARVKGMLQELRRSAADAPDGNARVGRIGTMVAEALDALEPALGATDAALAQRDASVSALNRALQEADSAISSIVRQTEEQRTQIRTGIVSARRHSSNIVLVADILACILGLGFAPLIARSITRPIGRLTLAMRRLAARDLTIEIPGVGRRDEIGVMAAAVQVFKDSMNEAELLADLQRREQNRKAARAARIEELNAAFDLIAREALDQLGAAAGDLRATADSMSRNTDTASRQAGAVAVASQLALGDVESVAAATGELSLSIQEISQQVAQSSTIAGQAVNEAAETSTTIRALSEAAQRVHDVVDLIRHIAGQTNLLALNASIEAARAGTAGAGFAVVAAEVKNLATQTKRATEDIAGQIGTIQQSTADAVAAILRIETTIRRMNDVAIAITAAIEQQDAATRQIAATVKNTAARTGGVSGNIVGLTQIFRQSGEASVEVLGAADELGRQAGNLRTHVSTFLADIRAA